MGIEITVTDDLIGPHHARRVMQWLREFLFEDPRYPLWNHCLRAFAVALLPEIVVQGSVGLILAAAGIDATGWSGPERHVTAGDLLLSVMFAPVVETALLGAGLGLLSRWTQNRLIIVTASALVWGGLHATTGILRLLPAAWSFFVFSCSYLVWRKSSQRDAFVAAAVPHGLINLTAYAMIGLAEYVACVTC